MILPQSEAFQILKQRLDCVPNFFNKIKFNDEVLSTNTKQTNRNASSIDFKQLLEHFKSIQDKQLQMKRSKQLSFLSNISNCLNVITRHLYGNL